MPNIVFKFGLLLKELGGYLVKITLFLLVYDRVSVSLHEIFLEHENVNRAWHRSERCKMTESHWCQNIRSLPVPQGPKMTIHHCQQRPNIELLACWFNLVSLRGQLRNFQIQNVRTIKKILRLRSIFSFLHIYVQSFISQMSLDV